MELFQIFILALIQGVTEFLPISSSGHLILPSEVLNWPDQGLAFDIAVHVGTLAAVLIYFRKDVGQILWAWLAQFGAQGQTQYSRLGWYIIVGTIPAGLAGLLFKDMIELHLRSGVVIAIASIVFGLLLWWSDSTAKQNRALAEMTLAAAILIGIAQAFALIPGTSRSGATMTMALFVGLSRTDAARFSFLLSIPVIFLSGLLQGFELANAPELDWLSIIIGMGVSAVSAYACIHFFLEFIAKVGMLPFVIYRIVLGLILLFIFSGYL